VICSSIGFLQIYPPPPPPKEKETLKVYYVNEERQRNYDSKAAESFAVKSVLATSLLIVYRSFMIF
jgi:hypothetical protein